MSEWLSTFCGLRWGISKTKRFQICTHKNVSKHCLRLHVDPNMFWEVFFSGGSVSNRSFVKIKDPFGTDIRYCKDVPESWESRCRKNLVCFNDQTSRSSSDSGKDFVWLTGTHEDYVPSWTLGKGCRTPVSPFRVVRRILSGVLLDTVSWHFCVTKGELVGSVPFLWLDWGGRLLTFTLKLRTFRRRFISSSLSLSRSGRHNVLIRLFQTFP